MGAPHSCSYRRLALGRTRWLRRGTSRSSHCRSRYSRVRFQEKERFISVPVRLFFTWSGLGFALALGLGSGLGAGSG